MTSMKDGDIFWKFDDTPLELLDNAVRFEWAEYILQTVFLFRCVLNGQNIYCKPYFFLGLVASVFLPWALNT